MPSLEERLAQAQQGGDQLAQRLQAFQAAKGGGGDKLELARQPGALETGVRSAAKTFIDNALGLPDLAVTAGVNTGVLGPMFRFQGELAKRYPGTVPEPPELPKIGQRVLPIPRLDEISAAVRTVPKLGDVMTTDQTLPEAFHESQNEQQQANQAYTDVHPRADWLGGLAGDAATVVTGRGGIKSALKAAGPKASMPASRALVPYVEPGLKKIGDEIWRKIERTHIPRGVGRAAETGLEGAVLAALDEGDVGQTAALAAGSQLGSSAILTAASPFLKSKTMWGALGASALTLQILQQYTPGGDNRVLDAVAASTAKIVPLVAAGLLVAVAGGKRPNPEGMLNKNLPMIADAVSAMPRGAVLSMIKDAAKDKDDGNDTTEKVLTQFVKAPDYFGPGAMVRLERAINSGKLSAEVQSLMDVPEFRKLVDGLDGEEQGQ